jgi:Uma2 family endonuclease
MKWQGGRVVLRESSTMVERTVLTYDGMEASPSDGLRRELLGGELYLSSAPSPTHQFVVGEIFSALRAYGQANGGIAFASPIDVVFSQVDATQPDVVYLAPDRLPLIGKKGIMGPPSLIVEVLSPASSDVDPGRKLQVYARHGAPEYWIVDPVARAIRAHADPSGEQYLRVERSADGRIASLTLPGLAFELPKAYGPAAVRAMLE